MCLIEMGDRFPDCFLDEPFPAGSPLAAAPSPLLFAEATKPDSGNPKDKRAPAGMKLRNILMKVDRIPVGR